MASERRRSNEKIKERKPSLPVDFNNLNFDILNPDHLSKIQGRVIAVIGGNHGNRYDKRYGNHIVYVT